MKRFFKEKWMIDKRCSTDKSVKAGMAERMIRTIRHRLHRYFSEKNTERWVDVIEDIMGAINRSVCRATGMRPIDINEDNANRLWERLYGDDHRPIRRTSTFKKDDAVRLALDKPVFKKGTMPTFTDEIFRVDEAVANGLTFENGTWLCGLQSIVYPNMFIHKKIYRHFIVIILVGQPLVQTSHNGWM
jgi:hypothetical protein